MCNNLSYAITFILLQVCHVAIAQLTYVYRNNEGIEISEANRKVLFYQIQPKSFNGLYERAGYVHPLYDLNETIITEDFPEDHPYHYGVFWAWHQIIIKDKKIADGWIYDNLFFQPVSVKPILKKNSLKLRSTILWKSIYKNISKPIIKESASIIIYKSSLHFRVIDFDIHLKPLIDDLKIGGSEDAKGYGGFCIRMKLPADISFESEGKTIIPADTAVTAGNWMNFTGTFDKNRKRSGIVILNHPSNDGKHNKWILRKTLSMQNVPYPGNLPVLLHRKGLRLKYRVIIHDGMIDNNGINQLYRIFSRT